MKEWSSANNERARVPVLRYVLGDGVEKVMPESNEMNLFIDSVDENPKYTPQRESPAYREMQDWWNWCDNELKPMIDLYKYGLNLKFDPAIHPLHTAELQKLMSVLEDKLMEKNGPREFPHLDAVRGASEARQNLTGPTCLNRSVLLGFTLADIAIIPFIRQIMRTREGEFDFTAYPRVLVWTNSIIETDWFQSEVMKKE